MLKIVGKIWYGDTIWPIAHFFWGYSITFPIFLIIFWLVTRNVKVSNLWMFFKKRAVVGIVGGLWAMIPDLDYLIQGLSLHSESWTDIFIFHYSFDQVLSETDLYFAGEMLLLFAVVNFFAIVVVVESFNRLKEAMFGKKEEDGDEEKEE